MILVAWLVLFLGGIIVTFIRLKQREKLRGEAGHTYDARDHGLAVNLDQHLGPAPAYYTHQDVNASAPYTLNPHPIPRQSSDSDDVIETEKRAATNIHGAWTPKNNQNQNTYNNEKEGGFL